MTRFHVPTILAFAIAAASLPPGADASMRARDELRIAVAANFKLTLERLVATFVDGRSIQVAVSSGASGLLYGQIVQGAPFDVFFSADPERPRRLERAGLTVGDSRFTYALGVLALWRPGGRAEDSLDQALRDGNLEVLAIANPDTAPYGAAAIQVLGLLGLDRNPPFRIVRGESIGQAFQFVASGNAAAGFVALSQLIEFDAQNDHADSRSEALLVDPALYEPIVQQAVRLAPAHANRTAAEFLDFVRSSQGREIIREAGYRLPDDPDRR